MTITMSEAHSRKNRLQTLDQMLQDESPKPYAELLRETSLEWGITESTLTEYLDVLNYQQETQDGEKVVVPA